MTQLGHTSVLSFPGRSCTTVKGLRCSMCGAPLTDYLGQTKPIKKHLYDGECPANLSKPIVDGAKPGDTHEDYIHWWI